MNKGFLVVAVVLTLGFIMVLIAVAVISMNQKSPAAAPPPPPPLPDPAYVGLPTVPPPLESIMPPETRGTYADAQVQDLLNTLFSSSSTCWHINNYLRVTLPQLIKEAAILAKYEKSRTKDSKFMLAFMKNVTASGIAAFEKCPPTATVTADGETVTVATVLANFKKGKVTWRS